MLHIIYFIIYFSYLFIMFVYIFISNYDFRKLFVGGLSWETQQGIFY